mgnify:CR=1 FL=1
MIIQIISFIYKIKHPMEKEQPLVVKIIFEGNSGVGKTSLVYRET